MSRTRLFGIVSCLVLASSAPARADDAENRAVAFVEKLGGRVARDDTKPGKPVVEVRLNLSEITDAGLRELAPFKSLTTLHLGDTQVTDAGLKDAAALRNLAKLDLSYTAVTDAEIQGLVALKNLTTLYLHRSKVTNEGVKALRKALPKCEITSW
jgi:hypothetical protein